MDREYYLSLAKVRIERAEELILESKLLLEKMHFYICRLSKNILCGSN